MQKTQASPPLLTEALKLAELGFYVFPLIPNGKIPAIGGWPQKATRDANTIRAYWEKHPSHNIGIFTEKFRDNQSLIVIDVDVKDGKRGLESMDALELLYDSLPSTFVSFTPSGGRHCIYVTDTPTKSGVNVLGDGLDIRSAGGFIVAPGSVIDGKPYVGYYNLPFTTVPAWLPPLIGKPAPRTAKASSVIELLDMQPAIDRAIDYLTRTAPTATAGAGGDSTTYKVAAAVKDFGVSELTCLELLFEHWNDTKASPSWDYEDLALKIHNVYTYGRKPIGADNPEADFADITTEDLTTAPPAPIDFNVITHDRVAAPIVDVPYLIKGFLPAQGEAVAYGPPGSGKTFVMLDMCYCIAAGINWNDRRVTRKPIVYLGMEGGSVDLNNRFWALTKKYPDTNPWLEIIPEHFNFLKPDDRIRALKDYLTNVIPKKYGQSAGAVIVDTLSQAMPGGEENDSGSMTAVFDTGRKLKECFDGLIAYIHHPSKNDPENLRGHGSALGRINTSILINKNRITTPKQRTFATLLRPIHYQLKQVSMGKDRDGDNVFAAYVEYVAEAVAADEFEAKLTPLTLAAYQQLSFIVQDRDGKVVALEKDWKRECRTLWEDVNDKTFAKRLQRSRDELIEEKFIVCDTDGVITVLR